MNVKLKKITLIEALTVLVVVMCFCMYEINNNALIIFVFTLSLYILFSLKTGRKLSLKLDGSFHILFIFGLYILASTIWAINISYAGYNAFSYLLYITIVYLLYLIYVNSEYSFFRILYWSGIMVSIITVLFYGASAIASALLSSTSRLENTFSNVNQLGMLFAVTFIIAYYYFRKRHNVLNVVILVMELLLILATQSRKALMLAVISVIITTLILSPQKGKVKNALRFIMIITVFLCLIKFALSLEIFSTINERLKGMIAMFTGKGQMDGSSNLRKQYIKIGMTQFRLHPLLGIGFDNAKIYIYKFANEFAYTHNNFVEVLCNGGIIGFILYYSFHGFIISSYMKYKKFWNSYSKICFMFIFLWIIMDYGFVSYIEKSTWLYMLPIIIERKSLKKKIIHDKDKINKNNQEMKNAY